MKHLLISTILSITTLSLSAQTLNDFNRNHKYKLVYDEFFNPILHLTVKNISDKVITTVEVTVNYTPKNSDRDWTLTPEKYIAQVTVYPNDTSSVTIKVLKEKHYVKPSSFYISKIRYSDGTICDKIE